MQDKLGRVFDFQVIYYLLLFATILGITVAFGLFAAKFSWVLLCLILIAVSYCGFGFLLLGNRIERKPSPFYLFGGGAFIFGGSIFDMYATYLHSPTLDREANPVARLALTSNISVEMILTAGFLVQVYFCGIVFLFWRLFLKSYPDLISQLSATKLSAVFVELFAGPHRNLLAMFLGKVDAKYALLSISPILTATFLYRWYLGLEWFQLAPIRRDVFLLLTIITAVIAYTLIAKKSVEKLKK